jgi:hypothetical protein
MLNVRDLIRAWCAKTSYPVTDLMGRGRAAREGGLLTQGARGVNAPDAVPWDGAVLLLSTIASGNWRDVAEHVRTYGWLELVQTDCRDEAKQESFRSDTSLFPDGTTLLNALSELMKNGGTQRKYRLHLLKVDRSEVKPAAYLAVGDYEITPAGETRKWMWMLRFQPSIQAPTEQRPDVVEASFALGFHALNAMADLLAPNVAAANRARLQGSNENGPPVDADGPVPLDEPLRGANPKATTNTHLEASDRERESQVGFESQGDSSGGASVPTRKEKPNDAVRRARAGPAKPCAA